MLVNDQYVMMDLERYDITQYGFLQFPCVVHLDILTDLETEMKASSESNFQIFVRSCYVNTNPIDVNSFSSAEQKYIYSFLSMVLHKYIWCDPSVQITSIPHNIGLLWYNSATNIGIVPVLTHASVDLYNWHLKDTTLPFSLDNIDVNYSMTNDGSEHWFYKIMIAIEGESGYLFDDINNLQLWMDTDDEQHIIEFMNKFVLCLTNSNKCFKRIYEHCDPEYFFNKLRIYLHGSENIDNKNGLKIEDTCFVLKLKGGSAAQSTLIQLWDAIFSVTHDKHSTDFLEEMQRYMPHKHLDYYDMIKNRSKIADYVKSKKSDKLNNSYNECVKSIVTFRKIHFDVVHSYIFKFIGMTHIKLPLTSHELNIENEKINKFDQSNKGTGGTDPAIFLSNTINNTSDAKLNDVIIKSTNMNYLFIFSCVICIMIAYWHHNYYV